MPQFVALRASLGSSTASGGRHRDWPQALHRSALRPLKDHPDRPQKMGPTSLPTPLSPMRGLARRQGLGIRCLPVRAVRKQALPVLSPALAPASGSALMLTRLSAPGRETLASFPGRPSTGGSAISPSVHGRDLEGMNCRSGPKTFPAISPRHPTGLVRSMKDVLLRSIIDRHALDRSPRRGGLKNAWTAPSMSFRSEISP